jgi:hypothetical protein
MGDSTLPARNLEAILSIGRGVAERLDSNEKLSLILPAASEFFQRVGDRVMVRLLRLEMYGLKTPRVFSTQDSQDIRMRAAQVFCELHAISDTRALAKEILGPELTTDDLGRISSQKSELLTGNSIEKLERLVNEAPGHISRLESSGNIRAKTETQLMLADQQDILHRVRMYVAEHVRQHCVGLENELENQRLLGVDYRIVLDSLRALDTSVGDELRVAVDSLRSENPASWSAAALICRNVVLALGRTLWNIAGESYQSEIAGRVLVLKGETEKNRLSAYIDQFYSHSAGDVPRSRLLEIDEVARRVYETGSKGKARIRFEEARGLVVDTFRLVADLDELTSLVPLGEYLVTPA